MRRAMMLFVLLAPFYAAGCATTGADDLAVGTACAARESACIRECDKAFEQRPNSWDYAECTDRCRASRGSACP